MEGIMMEDMPIQCTFIDSQALPCVSTVEATVEPVVYTDPGDDSVVYTSLIMKKVMEQSILLRKVVIERNTMQETKEDSVVTISRCLPTLNPLDASSLTPSIVAPTCLICYESIPSDAPVFKPQCCYPTGTFCRPCMQQFFTSFVTHRNVTPLNCPSCRHVMGTHGTYLLQEFVDLPDVVQNYREMVLKDTVVRPLDLHKTPCPASSCNGHLIEQYIVLLRKSNMLCTSCNHTFCDRCLRPWSVFHDCTRVSLSVMFWSMSRDAKRCPECNIMIEKNGGCSHMHCHKCKADFCWYCRSTYANHQSKFHNRIVCPVTEFVTSKKKIFGFDPVTRTITKTLFVTVALAGGCVAVATAPVTIPAYVGGTSLYRYCRRKRDDRRIARQMQESVRREEERSKVINASTENQITTGEMSNCGLV